MKFLALCLLSLFFISSCATLDAKTIVVNNRRYYSVFDLCNRYGLRAFSRSDRVVLKDERGRSLEFKLNKRDAQINNSRHTLSFPVVYKAGTYVSEFDVIKHLDPILRPSTLKRHGNKVIVIDPGHGGKDHGASGAKYKEKMLTLKLAHLVTYTLRSMGYTVYLTRAQDSYVSLNARSEFANKYNADMFISLHFNASSTISASGIETYALTPYGAPASSSNTLNWKRDAGAAMTENSGALAHYINQQLIRSTRAHDRGVKRARFAVLRNTNCASVLVEAGFLTNIAEEQKLGSEAYLKNLARGVVNGILLYRKNMLKGQK